MTPHYYIDISHVYMHLVVERAESVECRDECPDKQQQRVAGRFAATTVATTVRPSTPHRTQIRYPARRSGGEHHARRQLHRCRPF